MGCDIHAHLEVKVKDSRLEDGKWLYYSPAKIKRWYSLFCKMAGVRCGGAATTAKPLGLPDDTTAMTMMHCDDMGVDGHSHSRLSHSEICDLIVWAQKQNIPSDAKHEWRFRTFGAWLFGNSIASLFKYPDEYPSTLLDIRLVFWFDN